MKTALTCWKGRIAPVFDVARQVCIVRTGSGRVLDETTAALPADGPAAKVHRLTELGIDVLICGAISQSLQKMAEAHGIRVIAFVAGEVRDVLAAWMEDTIDNSVFAMPGCRGRRRRHRNGRRETAEKAAADTGD